MKSYTAKKPYESSVQTRRMIRSAFIELASELPFNKVSVREICKRMGITRTAFYYHYDDLYAVLDDTLAEIFESACLEDLLESWVDSDMRSVDVLCKVTMERIRDYTIANRCTCLLDNAMLAGYLTDYVIRREIDRAARCLADKGGIPLSEARRLFRFAFCGVSSLYRGQDRGKSGQMDSFRNTIRLLIREEPLEHKR